MTQEHLSWVRNYLQEKYQTPILENFLGLEVVELAEGIVIYQVQMNEHHRNIYGSVHGGTLASISDVAMGVSCLTLGKRVVTIDMNVSYIKNVTQGSILTAVGEVVSNGKTIMRAVGEIYHEEQLLVRAQASFFVLGVFTEKDYHVEAR
ncbi:hotdog fold thioesterase [Heliobacillus mobilis]|uniref:Hotdog fold thioesterase n=1 Tax=Heliobacterium mobile TaxID=28064 RepID=A0A6I3SHI0_HELMO|nr:PaaI family thioesterase [Heliobacterium mobile]MTV48286.1 hotdog fold thioesterase [Heliobacterium mobile]